MRPAPSLACFAALSLTCAAGPAGAQAPAFPSKAVRVVVPYAAGGFTDIIARLLAQRMSERLGQAVVVENKPGASTAIGAELVARAAPDGHTLLMGVTTTLSTNPYLFRKLPYKPADFKPVALTGMTPFVLVANPGVAASGPRELVDLARAKPKSLTVATLGVGSSTHLVLAMFEAATASRLVDVPYKGSAPAMTDLMAGHVQLYFDALPTSLAPIRAGQLKAYAITAEARSAAAPNIPTFRESGVPDMVAYSWYGLLAPAATPDAVADTLNRAANEALAQAAVQERLVGEGAVAPTMNRAQFGDLIERHSQVWAKTIAPLKLQLDSISPMESGLEHFVTAQDAVFDTVCAELAAGRKRSHWMWFVFPQLRALGRSDTARFYGIADLAEARAYWQHALLGPRLRRTTELVLAVAGRSAHDIFGSPDDLKLRSSMTLFERAAGGETLFGQVLERFYGGRRDDLTLAILDP